MKATQLVIHTSNQLSVLMERIADRFAVEPLPPRESEVIVVQSQGMARWVTLELARKLGIAASLDLPFPAAFCDDLAQRLGEDEPPAVDPFERGALTWRLFTALGATHDEPCFDPVRTYLRGDSTGIRRYQLATRLAGRFDDYQIYRPEMLSGWEKGKRTFEATDPVGCEHEAWQAELWRALVEETPHPPLAGRFERLLRRAQEADVLEDLPRRITVFGMSSLPPIFLKVLASLAQHVPVTIAFVSPTPEFWSDLRSEKEQRKRGQLDFDWEAPERALMTSSPASNPLLASLGRQGRELFTLLQELDASGQAWEPLDFEPPPRDSLLHHVQADIQELIDRRPGATELPIEPSPEDRSLELHACHSPRREMEVLRDRLLDAFERDPELTPDQVLVLVPEITRYAPYIQAVFEVPVPGIPRLPIHIADRVASTEDPLMAAFLLLLRTARGRFTSSDLLGLLDQAPIRNAFGIAEPDLPIVRQWVEATRVTWGLDSEQRSHDHELPPFEAPTWRSAVDRLLLGFATGPCESTVGGILPHGEVLAGRTELLGRFAEFVETCDRHLRVLREPHGGADWAAALQLALDQLFHPSHEDEEAALLEVRRVVGELGWVDELAQRDESIDPAVIEEHFDQAFAAEAFGKGFLSGRITFCALKPMRTIPFRLIAIAGLDDTSFPRPTRPPHFDLISRRARLGDRSIREDDRYLFLETLLAAQDRLILSWVGQSQKDDGRPAPSLCLTELLDQIGRMLGSLEKAHELIVWHKMHAFSPAYFDGRDPHLFSYSTEECAAGSTYRQAREELPPFLPEVPSEPPVPLESPRDVELMQLVELWVHPAKFYCRQVLQLSLFDVDPTGSSEEPFALSSLDRYLVDDWLFARMVDAPPERDHALASLRQLGYLPARTFGETAFVQSYDRIRSFVERMGPSRHHEPVSGELSLRDRRLRGRVDFRAHDGVRLLARPSSVKPKDLLRAWISHLFLCGLASQGVDAPRRTQVFGTDGSWELAPVDDWETPLRTLLDPLDAGFHRPLCFFGFASFHYAELVIFENRSPEEAARKVSADWRPAWKRAFPSESEDLYNALCFRQREPLAEPEFDRLARLVWEPFFSSTTRTEGT